ncbi:MAG: phosphotransferase, partial [Spirochaetaceae bacterium]|nr:phosphotransferase [Spirochaetaceae bacterium]
EPFFQVYGADNPDPEPGQAEVADAFWNRKEACIELMKMRDIYGKKLQCIVHGDLHTSNTLISPTEMKVIDMEYPHMGPFSADSGYLLGNIVYPYAAWFFHPEWNEDKRAAYREEMLGYIEGMLDEYIAVFSECWKQSVRPIFKRYPEYLASLLLDFLQETAGFMGSQVGSRAGGYTETFDFDVLPDARRRNMARGLALAIGYALLMRRGSVRCPADITAIIRETAEAFMGNPLKGAAVIGNFSGAL